MKDASGGSLRARSRRLASVPPSGSRPAPMPEIGIGAHAEDADGFAGGLLERDRVLARGKARARAAEIEVGLLPHLRQPGRGRLAVLEAALDDLQSRIPFREHFARAVPEVARPQRDFRFREVLLEQAQRTRGVPDVPDVHALPGTAEEDARRATSGGSKPRGKEVAGKCSRGSGKKEITSFHNAKLLL